MSKIKRHMITGPPQSTSPSSRYQREIDQVLRSDLCVKTKTRRYGLGKSRWHVQPSVDRCIFLALVLNAYSFVALARSSRLVDASAYLSLRYPMRSPSARCIRSGSLPSRARSICVWKATILLRSRT